MPPQGEERYLGAPRLPRAVEIPDPVVPADSFRPQVRIYIPALDSIAPADSLPGDTLLLITDSVQQPDSVPPEPVDTLPPDTVAPPDTATRAAVTDTLRG